MMATQISRRALLVGRQAPGFRRILPPGATDDGLLGCSGCGNCADACPTHIISLVDGLPSVDFSLGECTLCGECRTACPEPVFEGCRPSLCPHRRDRRQLPGETGCCMPVMRRKLSRTGDPFPPASRRPVCSGSERADLQWLRRMPAGLSCWSDRDEAP